MSWHCRPAAGKRPKPSPPESAKRRPTTPAERTTKHGVVSPLGRGPGPPVPPGDATNSGPLPRPPGSGRPVHGHRLAGPRRDFPLPRCRRQGWRNRARAPSQADVLTADVLNRVREALRLLRRGRGAGQPQLAVMPRPCEAGALLCERSNRRGTADRMPFLLSPSAFGLSASVCRWQGRGKPYTKSKSRGEAC